MSDNDSIRARLKTFSEKLPESKDEYYDTPAARIDTIIGGDSSHYIRLSRCKKYYDELADAVPVGQGFLCFTDFMREWYGVKMILEPGGMYASGFSLDYEIIDEQKYLLFRLKFTND